MLKVLIADDEEMARAVIRRMLESCFKEKLSLFEASNGKETVQLALAEKMDVIFLDIDMPILNGVEAGRKIKEQLTQCSIIFLTAYAQFGYAKQAISMGAAEYLVKPVEDREVIAAMGRELQKRQPAEGDAGAGEEHASAVCGPVFLESSLGDNPVQQAEAEPLEPGAASQARAAKIAMEARRMIETQYRKELSMDEIAGQFQLSVNHFNKIFKQFNGVPCKEYIINVRVEKAKEYLKSPQMNIREAGILVGYTDSNYFSRIFKKKTGLTPIEYRNQLFFVPENNR